MTQTSTIKTLACVSLLVVFVPPFSSARADEALAVPDNVSAVFREHCLDCHSGDSAEGDVRLDALAKAGRDDAVSVLAKVREQLHLDRMPPEDEPRLPGEARCELVAWLSTTLAGTTADAAFRAKMQRPEYGNYVDHEKLFSGEITAEPFSPPRLWRRSPDHFDLAKQTYFGVHGNPGRTVGEVDKLQQPFHAGDADGIADYAALFYADSATFDTLYRNAAFVVDRTLLLAFIEYDYRSRGKTLDDWKADRAKVLEAQQEEIERYKREGKTTRYIGRAHRELNAKYELETPQVYRDVILGDGEPTRDQMEAAIRYHFHRTGQDEPTREELDKYTDFMRAGSRRRACTSACETC